MRKIVFFTQSYPYSNNYSWKRNELAELVKKFEVEVIPFIYTKEKLHDVPGGVKVYSPLLQKLEAVKQQLIFKVLLSPRRMVYIREFFSRKVYKKRKWLAEWLGTAYRIEKLIKHPVIADLVADRAAAANTILYFYWGVGASILVPYLRPFGFKKIIVRFHGFDLYEERREGYLPFRKGLLQNLDGAVYISEAGLNYARKKYPGVKYNAHIFKLGSKSATPPPYNPGEYFRVVSCSNVIPLKQVDLIAKALHFIPFKLEWWHLGDGPDLEKVMQLTQSLPANVRVNLVGRVHPDDVIKLYSNTSFDLFVNFSQTEGLPVSIMEAFSAGIPVIAPDVGGVGEIVCSENGKLITPNLTPEELAQEIASFYNLSAEHKLRFRTAALATYKQKCDFDKLTEAFVAFLEKE